MVIRWHASAMRGCGSRNIRTSVSCRIFTICRRRWQWRMLRYFAPGRRGLRSSRHGGVPAILIPYPYAAENHQEKNARAMEAAGAAEVILNRDLDGAVLTEALRTLLSDDVRRAGMAAAMKRLGKPQAAEEIAALALRISKGEG